MRQNKGVRALVAEDDYLIREMIVGYLEDLTYEVAGQAKNGREAVEMTQALQPDVVILDLRMPDMGGIEAAERINELCPTPIVVLTAFETPELLEKTSQAGVGAYLIKPSNTSELERAITIARARFGDLMKLREMNQELQVRNEDLAAFSHTVAHDIQNLLQLINGFSEALYNYHDSLDEEDLQTCVSSIMRNVAKMSSITKELLLFSEVRKIKVMLRPIFDMGKIVEEVQKRLISLIEENHAEIQAPSKWPVAMGHGPWIEEVWLNLLSNAIIYGGDPPVVEVGATKEPEGWVRFWVRDNGPGIDAEAQAQLFKPFDDITQIKLQGNGLGLSIARRIVEKLEGEIDMESEGGKGSTFFFKLRSVDHY